MSTKKNTKPASKVAANKKFVAKRTVKPSIRSQAAKKAWVTIRANRAAAAKLKAPKQAAASVPPTASGLAAAVGFTADFNKLASISVPPPAPPKLVKGLIKTESTLADWEKKGQFGVSNINARGLTKEQITGGAPVPAVSIPPQGVPAPFPVSIPPLQPPAYPSFRYSTLGQLFQPGVWIKGDEALDANGNCVQPKSPNACKFCLTGGLQRVYGDNYHIQEQALVKVINAYTLGRVSKVVSFNDDPATNETDIRRVIALAGV